MEKDITPLKIFNNIRQTSNRKYVLKDALDYIRPWKPRIKNRTEVYNNITKESR